MKNDFVSKMFTIKSLKKMYYPRLDTIIEEHIQDKAMKRKITDGGGDTVILSYERTAKKRRYE